MGQVCQKHQEFYDMQCKWCEAPGTYDVSEARALLSAFIAEVQAKEPDLSESTLDRHGGCE